MIKSPHLGTCWLRRRVIVKVPEDAFEMNYVFTDGEGATDNNMGQNYLTLLDSNMTAELWAEKAMERQVCHGCFCCLILIASYP